MKKTLRKALQGILAFAVALSCMIMPGRAFFLQRGQACSKHPENILRI